MEFTEYGRSADSSTHAQRHRLPVVSVRLSAYASRDADRGGSSVGRQCSGAIQLKPDSDTSSRAGFGYSRQADGSGDLVAVWRGPRTRGHRAKQSSAAERHPARPFRGIGVGVSWADDTAALESRHTPL